MRKQIAAANWKMNLGISEAEKLTDELLQSGHQLDEFQVVLLAVPFPYLMRMKEKFAGKTNVYVTAQNCASSKNGAYTGEVSCEMLQSIGIEYVLIGHSERREYFNETNEILARKIDRALSNNVNPVFCCGEPLTIREAGNHNSYVETQLKESLFHLPGEDVNKLVIAYEPIWAIGTGKTASSDQAQEMHANIRKVITEKYGTAVAANISILYGGSVKGANAAELFSKPDVDGGLVGGASLVAAEFAAIINGLRKQK